MAFFASLHLSIIYLFVPIKCIITYFEYIFLYGFLKLHFNQFHYLKSDSSFTYFIVYSTFNYEYSYFFLPILALIHRSTHIMVILKIIFRPSVWCLTTPAGSPPPTLRTSALTLNSLSFINHPNNQLFLSGCPFVHHFSF